MKANKSVETNRRPASPLNAVRQFGSASCAPPLLSAAVAHLWRSTPFRVNLDVAVGRRRTSRWSVRGRRSSRAAYAD